MSAIEWGNVPAYLGAGAFFVAAASYWRAGRDARASAARKVWVMPAARKMLEEQGVLDPDEPSVYPDHPWIAVHNASDEPVYKCVVHVLPLDWRTNRVPIRSPWFDCIHPASVAELIELRGVKAPRGDRLPVQIEFRDGRGKQWLRDPDGRLRHIPDWRRPGKLIPLFPQDEGD